MSRPRLGSARSGPEFVHLEEGDGWVDYDFAVVRALAHVHLGSPVNVGVVVHARVPGFLEARVVDDADTLRARLPGVDVEVLARYLATYAGVARGDETCGPLALAPASERFHWLTSPRSDVLQASDVHAGRTRDLDATVERLFRSYVTEAR